MSIDIAQTGGPTQAVLEVSIEAGYSYVRVETADPATANAWIPQPALAIDGSEQIVTLTIPADRLGHAFRVACFESGSAEAGMFSGTSEFAGEAIGASSDRDAQLNAPPTASPGFAEDSLTTAGSGADREVTDADIWAIDGDRLYFFNRNVGLQVINISDPDNAMLVGQLALPGRGEKLIPLGPNRVLLVAGRDCGFEPGDSESEGIVVDVSSAPAVTATFAIDGSVVEARTVGTALYVVSHQYYAWNNADAYHYNPRTSFQTFDLSNPDAPVAVEHVLLDGWSRFIHATPNRAVLGYSDDWRNTTLCVYDISSPVGNLVKKGDIQVAGRVEDEFKVWIEDDLLAVTSQEWDTNTRVWDTAFRTHDLSGPSPVQLGEVRMALNEQLFGSRITDERTAYIVTFEQIDPLWIVDFTNPAAPEILGELEIPGFSTYLLPMGDDLLSIGTESGRVAVSLFDVSNPANPTMASRIRLGDRWSWSEAVYEEKAFTVLPDASAILVPFSSPSGSGLQFIDLLPGQLVERGFLAHPTAPRRATAHQDRFIAIDSRAVTVIDAADRDEPEVVHEVTLSYPTTHIFAEGMLRVELDGYNLRPRLRVNNLLGAAGVAAFSYDLPDGTIRATHHVPGTLHLVQEVPGGNTMRHLVVDLSNLADITWESVEFTMNTGSANDFGYGNYANFSPLVPSPGILVWKVSSYYYYDDVLIDVPFGGRLAIAPGNGTTSLLAIDHRGDTPEIVSQYTIEIPEGASPWSISTEMFAGGNNVFIGREYTIYTDDIPEEIPPYVQDQINNSISNGATNVVINLQKRDLLVVDYSDPANPVERPPVDFPGRLSGVSDDGIILYAAIRDTRDERGYLQGATDLAALSYDGAATYLLDRLTIGDTWGSLRMTVDNRDLHLIAYDPDGLYQLRPVSLVGRDLIVGTPLTLGQQWVGQPTRQGDLLFAQSSQVGRFFDVSNSLTPLELPFSSSTTGCIYPNVTNGSGNLNGFAAPAGAYGVLEYTP